MKATKEQFLKWASDAKYWPVEDEVPVNTVDLSQFDREAEMLRREAVTASNRAIQAWKDLRAYLINKQEPRK